MSNLPPWAFDEKGRLLKSSEALRRARETSRDPAAAPTRHSIFDLIDQRAARERGRKAGEQATDEARRAAEPQRPLNAAQKLLDSGIVDNPYDSSAKRLKRLLTAAAHKREKEIETEVAEQKRKEALAKSPAIQGAIATLTRLKESIDPLKAAEIEGVIDSGNYEMAWSLIREESERLSAIERERLQQRVDELNALNDLASKQAGRVMAAEQMLADSQQPPVQESTHPDSVG